METSHITPKFKKWMRQCISDEFSSAIDENLKTGDREPYDVAQKIINSREMTELTHVIRSSFLEQMASRPATRQNSAFNSAANSRPQTSQSYASDFSEDEWQIQGGGSAGGIHTDEIGKIVDLMGYDKPDHVRLAGYESLLKYTELASMPTNNSWSALLKTLRDGLVDGNRSVFESSLLVHAKLLGCPVYSEVYANVLEALNELYRTKRQRQQSLAESMPTITSGVNFKVFLHEKLFRLIRLLLDHHEEVLKASRTIDKPAEEMIDQFVSFLSGQASGHQQKRPLGALQIISVLEPRANWSRKWMHGLITRKTFCSAISKSPTLMHRVVECVKRGLESPAPTSLSFVVRDGHDGVFVSGETVETLGFLHCLNLLVQLCATSTGRSLLSETQTEDSFSIPDFLSSLLGCLNSLASSSAPNAVYEMVRSALSRLLLGRSTVLYDARFYQVALNPLLQTELRMWPHTLDVLAHVLDTPEGPGFMIAECRASSASIERRKPNYPVATVIAYASGMLRQPVAVMSVEHAVDLFGLIGKIFRNQEAFAVVEDMVRDSFYPSLAYMYGKLDKYYIENENKTQQVDKAVRDMLINLVSIPLGLQMLSNEPLIFEELIRGSIAPVRASWSAYNVIGFVSNSGFLSHGVKVLKNLAPHVLTTLLVELSKNLEDPRQFYDPWESPDANVFLHVLALFSLNTRCFLAFMTKDCDDGRDDESSDYARNLRDFFQRFTDPDSPYHHLGLKALKIVLWNLDVYLFLLDLLDFQNKLLEFQAQLAYDPTKKKRQKNVEDDDDDAREEEEEEEEEEQPEYEDEFTESPSQRQSDYIVDECSMLRHAILLNSYYVRLKRNESLSATPEETCLFSSLPPEHQSLGDDYVPRPSSGSELALWLSDSGPGLRDNVWVLGTRRAHKASPGPIASKVLLNLLDQMEKAIPTVEWVDVFKWDPKLKCSDDYWLPVEERGIDLIVHYGTMNGLLQDDNADQKETKSYLKVFIQSAYDFIGYKKPEDFEGFDWFLATVFLICEGNVEKAKTFVNQIVHFPSAMFMWPTLAKVVDDNEEEEASTRLLFAHLLESIIGMEFPKVKFALKNECGIDWWMICDRMMSQCFMGILPWSEITHYFAICILHSPDYVLYYCASLLNHCEDDMIKSLTKGQMWPEDMVLEDYRCHSQIGFMDRLGKRYGGKVLQSLTQGKLSVSDNFSTTSS